MRLIVLSALMALSGLVSGCSVNAEPLDDDYLKEFVRNIKFARHPSGICIGIVASRRTASPDSTGIAGVVADCDLVRDYIVE